MRPASFFHAMCECVCVCACGVPPHAVGLLSSDPLHRISANSIRKNFKNNHSFVNNENIRCDRLESPRVKVPENSIGITEQFTNIYTFESPGGWNIIGNTPKKIFLKKNLKDPALIKPGDKVSFYQISKKDYLNWND